MAIHAKTVLSFILLLLIQLPVLARPQAVNSGKVSLVYHGPGTCEQCPEAIATALEREGFKTIFVFPGQFTKALFAKADLYVQPGGTDNIDETLDALSTAEILNLKSFVAQGGRYLGICAGGYLAGQYSDELHTRKAFGLLPHLMIDEELESSDATLLSVFWGQHKRTMYFQGGPSFGSTATKNTQVIARYADSGHIAAQISPYGKGFVGVIGPHPEADQDWFQEDDLSIEDGLSFDLLHQFTSQLFANPKK